MRSFNSKPTAEALRFVSLFLILFVVLNEDECTSGIHNFSVYAVFNNIQGSHNCTCQEGFHVIYQTRETVFYRDIQTPRRELKVRRAAEYF